MVKSRKTRVSGSRRSKVLRRSERRSKVLRRSRVGRKRRGRTGRKGGKSRRTRTKRRALFSAGGGAIEELGDRISGIGRLEMLAMTGESIFGGTRPTDDDIEALKEAYAAVEAAYQEDYTKKYATLHDKVVDMLKKLEKWKETATTNKKQAAIKLNPIIKNLVNAREAMRASQGFCLEVPK
jgi:hypothetical protein